jgi:hypothetical protein
MRSILFLCALLSAAPATAGPLTACDFITQAEVEKMLGEKVGPPAVTDGGICAGLCPSINDSRCDFSTLGENKKEFYFYVLLPPYAFPARSERKIYESDKGDRVVVQDVPGLGKDAFWYYRYDIKQSLLFVYRGDIVHLMVQEIGVDPHPALANAARASALALERFKALKKSQLKNAFEFETFGDTYPWRH